MWRVTGTTRWYKINKYKLLGNGGRLFVARAYYKENCSLYDCPIGEGGIYILVVRNDIGSVYCKTHSPYSVEVHA